MLTACVKPSFVALKPPLHAPGHERRHRACRAGGRVRARNHLGRLHPHSTLGGPHNRRPYVKGSKVNLGRRQVAEGRSAALPDLTAPTPVMPPEAVPIVACRPGVRGGTKLRGSGFAGRLSTAQRTTRWPFRKYICGRRADPRSFDSRSGPCGSRQREARPPLGPPPP